jgi:hypothetical protein
VVLPALLIALAYSLPDRHEQRQQPGVNVGRTYQGDGQGAPIGTGGGADSIDYPNVGPAAISPSTAGLDLLALGGGAGSWRDAIGTQIAVPAGAASHVNDVAYWVGDGDNRLLVVLSRDRTDHFEQPRSGFDNPGSAATPGMVTGTVRRLPHAEAMFSWGLTNADAAALRERPIYLHVDAASVAVALGEVTGSDPR